MAQSNPGFLAPRHRKYLSGEYDFSEHSNPSQFRREIRNRVAGARRDWALLNSEILSKEDLLEANINIHDPRGISAPMTDTAIEENKKSVKAQADSVGLEGHDNLEKVLEEMMDDIEGHNEDEMRESVEEWLVSGVVETMKGMMEGMGGDSDVEEVVTGFIEGAWPDNERALEIAEKQLSTRE